MKEYKVIFCDLDGTLIDTISGETFPKGIWDMKIKFDVLDAIKKLNPEYILIVSNQGGIESGFVDALDFYSKSDYIAKAIREYCGCECYVKYCETNDKTDYYRKPNPGMLVSLLRRYVGLDLDCIKQKSLMIGDASGKEGQFSDSDKKTAENFGIDYMDVEDFCKGFIMNEKLNLVETLKDCPKGTKLYSTAFGDVYFYEISDNKEYPICIAVAGNSGYRTLTYDGKLWRDYGGECILFPSREQRDWSKFNPKKDWFVPPCEFKDGDILSYQCKGFNNRSIYIYRYHKRFNTSYYVALSGDDNEFRIDNTGKWALNGYNDTVRFATEDEKKRLFKAIKDNGYKWNAETKTLEKLVKPKFDPKTLKPFDKVLVRDECYERWRCEFYSYLHDDNGGYPYIVINDAYKHCIPYNDDTKHLVGTTKEAPEYYRYWED